MLEFQEKRRLKKVIYSKITLIVLLVLIVISTKAVWGVYQKQMIARENLKRTVTNFNNLKAREETLSSEIERLKTTDGLEEEIREKYGLVKPSEEVIVIVDEDKTELIDSSPSAYNLWQKIRNWWR